MRRQLEKLVTAVAAMMAEGRAKGFAFAVRLFSPVSAPYSRSAAVRCAAGSPQRFTVHSASAIAPLRRGLKAPEGCCCLGCALLAVATAVPCRCYRCGRPLLPLLLAAAGQRLMHAMRLRRALRRHGRCCSETC